MNINEIINSVKVDIIKLPLGERMIGSVLLALVSMTIVFIILACISGMISIMYRGSKFNKNIKEEKVNIKEVFKEEILDISNDNINQKQIIAAIIACIIQFSCSDSEIIVRKIKRSNNLYSNWNNGIEGINNDKNI